MMDEDEDARENRGLRPFSTQTMPSRFPSLRRLTTAEPYSHMSLPAVAQSPGSAGSNSEITFAVLYDDGPDYHLGRYEDTASVRSGRPGSSHSFAPSFRTRDSRIASEDHERNNSEFVANQRLLAQGYLNANDSQPQLNQQPYHAYSQETLGMNTIRHLDGEKGRQSSLATPLTNNTSESLCDCEDDHNAVRDVKDPSKFGNPSTIELEARIGPVPPTQTPLMEKEDLDAYVVRFRGPKDPLNPKSWAIKRKWAAAAVMATFTFISPLASSMVAPALGQIAKDFHITNTIESQMILSIFVLAYAVGPMFLAPMSELYGRVIVLQASHILFLAFNIACGFAQNKYQLMAFRFLSGLGGSAPLAIGGAVLGDLFLPEERGRAMGLYAMGPLLGPALGPVFGSWVAAKSTWRWMFWAVSIADGVILFAGLFKLQESYAPYILSKRAKQLRKETGNPKWRAEGEVAQTLGKKIGGALSRSFAMLLTQPIVQVLAIYMAFSYGCLYLLLSTFPAIFIKTYGESLGVSGLNYISLGLGLFVGAPVCGKATDNVYRRLKARDPRRQGKPEYRMPLTMLFSLLAPVGLIIYGWSAQNHIQWIVPNIGAFLFGMGTIAAFQCVTTYLVDTYLRFAASAVAGVTVLRSLAGFGFPLFGPAMYNALGYGWGNTVLALAAIGIGLPVPILLWVFGERLRKMSKIAAQARPPAGKRPGGRGPAGPARPGMQGPAGPGGPGVKGPAVPGGPSKKSKKGPRDSGVGGPSSDVKGMAKIEAVPKDSPADAEAMMRKKQGSPPRYGPPQ